MELEWGGSTSLTVWVAQKRYNESLWLLRIPVAGVGGLHRLVNDEWTFVQSRGFCIRQSTCFFRRVSRMAMVFFV